MKGGFLKQKSKTNQSWMKTVAFQIQLKYRNQQTSTLVLLAMAGTSAICHKRQNAIDVHLRPGSQTEL